ncbi:MAG TPA: GDSL-type esterase/lipase family protein [Candidatus Limnocylindria bacterium]|nr:GDSL-type esterase/lipase family protein [Candidatus Limnocylindria bacterium]
MKQALQKAAVACVGMLFALALCEGLVRVAPQSILPLRLRELVKRMELYRDTEGMYVADSELLFKIRPNTDTIAEHPDYRVRVKTNLNLDGIGFRGGSLGGPVWAAAVGDSFTFGVGVEQNDTWVARVAKALGREVVNLAIPAQGPAQYTRILKRYALPLQPRVIFYGFYFNDLDAANRFYRLKRNWIPVSRYLRQYSVIHNLLNESRASPKDEITTLRGDGLELEISAEGLQRTLRRQSRNFDRRWNVTVKELDDAVKASTDASIELVMLYLPSRWEVYWDRIRAQHEIPDSLDIYRLRRAVVEYCVSRQIACVDFTEVLKNEARQGKQLYFRTDGHWNEEGNRIVAEALQQFLTARGLPQ